MNIDDEIKQAKAALREFRETKFTDRAAGPVVAHVGGRVRTVRVNGISGDEYKRGLMSSTRADIERLRKLKRPGPDQTALIDDVAKALDFSLRNHADLPPDVLIHAARQVVKVFNGQKTKAVKVRHAKPSASKEKSAKIQDEWATGKYPTKRNCAKKAGHRLGMTPDAAYRALRNQPNPKRE